jgi:hypothetical protein
MAMTRTAERKLVKQIMAMPESKRNRIVEALQQLTASPNEDPSRELLALLLPPARLKRLLNLLLEEIDRQRRLDYAEERWRLLCRQRGLNWDAMSEEERADFIDQLLHEDRDVTKNSSSSPPEFLAKLAL